MARININGGQDVSASSRAMYEPAEDYGTKGKARGSGKWLGIIIVLIIIIALGAGAWWLVKNDKIPGLGGDNAAASTSTPNEKQLAKEKKEAEKLLAQVGKLIVLPEGEEPVVATIVDVEKLVAEQPFYTGAKNGDKVIIYMTARKAIIYSEDQNKLVNVGPVYMDEDAKAPAPAASAAPSNTKSDD